MRIKTCTECGNISPREDADPPYIEGYFCGSCRAQVRHEFRQHLATGLHWLAVIGRIVARGQVLPPKVYAPPAPPAPPPREFFACTHCMTITADPQKGCRCADRQTLFLLREVIALRSPPPTTPYEPYTCPDCGSCGDCDNCG